MLLVDGLEPACQADSVALFLGATVMPDGEDAEALRERSARAAEKIAALGEMTGGIVHDFRNILAAIESGLTQAEHHLADPVQLRFCLAALHEGVARGLKMTTQLLSFTKGQECEPGAADVNELLRKLEILMRFGAGPGIGVSLDLAGGLSDCRVDPGQFNAAILNLVINARDAMPGGGTLQVSTTEITASAASEDAKSYVRVRVKDTGYGMSPETKQHIFEPYFTTKGEAGTGLGMPQVHTLMNLVGGYISIESSVGTGTAFDLYFPVSEETPRPGTTLWRQVDRWVNEGGAFADRMPTPVHGAGATRVKANPAGPDER
jgi:signal transduction histidine kinase